MAISTSHQILNSAAHLQLKSEDGYLVKAQKFTLGRMAHLSIALTALVESVFFRTLSLLSRIFPSRFQISPERASDAAQTARIAFSRIFSLYVQCPSQNTEVPAQKRIDPKYFLLAAAALTVVAIGAYYFSRPALLPEPPVWQGPQFISPIPEVPKKIEFPASEQSPWAGSILPALPIILLYTSQYLRR